jgi:predicted dehydrogenase
MTRGGTEVQPVRIAIIGMGKMGTVMAGICKDLPQADLVAICERREDRLATLASELEVPGYLDYNEMLAKHPEIEVVDVETQATSEIKVPPCLAVIEAGKTLIAEGPLAMSVPAAEKIVEAAEKVGVLIFMNNTLPFEPHCAGAKQAIAKGEIGEILHLSLRHNLRREAGEYRKWECSIVWEIGWYDLALLRWLTEREVKKVIARGLEKDVGTGSPAAVVSVLTFDDGTLGVLEHGWASPQVMGRRTTMVMEIRGTKGVIDIDLLETGAKVFTPDSVRPIDNTYFPAIYGGQWSGVFHDQMAYHLYSVRSGAQPPATGRDGLTEVRICDAIHRSLETGEEITL